MLCGYPIPRFWNDVSSSSYLLEPNHNQVLGFRTTLETKPGLGYDLKTGTLVYVFFMSKSLLSILSRNKDV